MNVLPMDGGGLPVLDGPDGSGYLTPFVWWVDEILTTDNPLEAPGIPTIRSSLLVHGKTYKCDSVQTSRINDTCVEVTAKFSTDGRFGGMQKVEPNEEFKNTVLGYKKVPIKPPVMRLTRHVFKDGDNNSKEGQRWEESPDMDAIQLEFSVLSISVVLKELSNSQMNAIIRSIDNRIGEMHQFTAYPGRYWVMQPATIRNSKPGELRIDYSWESDPGNSSPTVLSPSYRSPPFRPPFHSYQVESLPIDPGDTNPKPPIIRVINNFPPEVISHYDANGNPVMMDNPKYRLDGYLELPGSPI